MISALHQKKQNILKLIKSDGFKKYFTNTSWLIVDNAVNLAIGFVIGVFVARYLGPSDFGLLNFAKTVAKLVALFCALGLERIVIKNLIYENQNQAAILGTAFGLKAIVSILCIVLFGIIGYFIFDDTVTYLLIFSFIIISLIESFVVIKYYFQSKVQARFISRVVVLKIIISSGIKLLMIYFKFPLIYFAYEAILEAMVGIVGYIIVFQKRSEVKIQDWKFRKEYGAKLLKDSWPLLVSSFVVYIYMETDIIIIKYMLGNTEVGYYSIAVRITTICYLGGSILCGALFPAILNAKSTNEALYLNRFSSLLRLLVGISFCVSIIVFLFGPYFITQLFGSEYESSIPSLQILIWSVTFVYLGVAGSQWYIAENLQKVLVTRTALGAIINIILNILLIPSFGINGAAIATLISQIIASFAGNLLSSQTRELFKLQSKAIIFSK